MSTFPRALLVALALFAGVAGPSLSTAFAENPAAALVAKPGALPDMALGSPKAPVTIVEYSSMTCPHCAAFSENVFPMLQSKYIDTGRVRFVSRQFPLDMLAVGAAMLAHCIANGDSPKFFDATSMIFKRQHELTQRPLDTLESVGDHFGMSGEAVKACEQDAGLFEKIKADHDLAFEQLKVDATPTFFVNGEKLRGSMSDEELDKKLTTLLER